MRLKDFVTYNKGFAFPSDSFSDDSAHTPLYKTTEIKQGKLNSPQNYIDEKKVSFSETARLKPGDIVLSTVGSRPEIIESAVGQLAVISDNEIGALMNQNTMIIRPSNKVEPVFLSYICLSRRFREYLDVIARGTANQSSIKVNDVLIFECLFPPFAEQQAIANYLDAKTQAIDKKVSLLEQKIETYKQLKRTLINQTITKGLDKNVTLKESGISCIGQIPQHWEVKRFKDVLNLFTGNSISDKNGFDIIENSIPYVSTKDIDFETNEINYENGMYIPKSDKTFKRAKKGTCLLCIEGANAGKKYGILNQEVAFVNKLSALKFIANRNFDKYLYYYIQSIAFSGEFFPLINGLIGGVSINKLKEFNIILPSKSEQEEIAQYLDKKTATIDAIISNIGKQIETLKQLRKTLINDVVTGKIKVLA